MKIKQRAAGLLACIILLNAVSVMGNPQNKLAPGSIDPVQVNHKSAAASGSDDIAPMVEVSFEKAPTNANSVIIPTYPSDDKAEAEYYKIMLTDSLGNTVEGKETLVGSLESQGTKYRMKIEDNLKNDTQFKNGRLYKLIIQPGHYHTGANGVSVPAPLSSAGEHPVRFFVTDFNTIARENNDKIEILWEYIPGAQYELVYTAKDANSIDAVKAKDENGVGSVTATLNESNIQTVTEGGIKKVKYTVEDSLPGQKYSAYVIVKNISHSFLTTGIGNVSINTLTPKIAHAERSVSLKVFNIGDKRIALNWQLGSWVGNKLLRTIIWRKTEGEAAYAQIGTINNKGLTPPDPGKFEHDEPNKNSYYKVEFFLDDGTVLSTKEELYVPYAIREQPLKPQVPSPYSDAVKSNSAFQKKDYLVKNDDIPEDSMKPNTFHVKSINPLQVQLVWDAPTKKTEAGSTAIDHEMLYDIWVTESDELLSSTEPVVKDLAIGAADSNKLIKTQDGLSIIGFKELLTDYFNLGGEKKLLVSNKTYYIKIVAKKNYSGVVMQSIPTIIAITIDKNGDIYAPPVLPKPPLRIKTNGITDKSVAIEWLEKWYEISAVNPSHYDGTTDEEAFFAKLWNSIVYTIGDAPRLIRFANSAGNLTTHILKTQTSVNEVKAAIGETNYNLLYRDREVTLGSDVKYEVKPILYDEVIKKINASNTNVTTPAAITIEKWIVENESDTTDGWATISPATVRHTDDGLDWKENLVSGLNPNTRYIILIRAYRIDEVGKKLQQTFPSYVIATTLNDYESPEADPTVPNLNPDGVTDSSVAVWWTYNKDFDYEIVYSRVDNPNTAKPQTFKISNTPGDENYVSDGAKASVKITGLMPETTYNVWIRAKQKKGSKISAWSTPVTQKTTSLGIPDSPRGLGPAAYQSILELGKDFPPVASKYITVEWLKDVNDIESPSGNEKQQKTYSYIVEFADNPEFLDAVVVNTSGEKGGSGEGDKAKSFEVLAKNIVRFNNLIANRPYYVRVKTVLTFKDIEGAKEIIKESEYTKWVRILTKTSSDEYDGGNNDNVVVYPNPIVEDYSKDVWTIEIVDSAKIISDLMKKNEYFLTVKAQKYNSTRDAAVRRIKIPKEVIDTLSNRGMELKVITNIGEYQIPAKALSFYTAKFGAKDILQLDFTTIFDHKIASILKQYPDKLLKAEQLDILIRSKSGVTAVKKIDGYLKAKIKLNATVEYQYKNLFAYTYNFDLGSWTKEIYSIETLTDTYISYSTPVTGIYAVYERANGIASSLSTYAMQELAGAYGISSLGITYIKDGKVGRDQYINLMLGIAQGKTEIDLSSPVYSDTLAKAKASGIYVGSGSGSITEEQAIAGIVKLYELKNGYKVKASSVTFNNVSSTYREAVSKAYALGLIDNISPKRAVTYGTLCDWILQVTK